MHTERFPRSFHLFSLLKLNQFSSINKRKGGHIQTKLYVTIAMCHGNVAPAGTNCDAAIVMPEKKYFEALEIGGFAGRDVFGLNSAIVL